MSKEVREQIEDIPLFRFHSAGCELTFPGAANCTCSTGEAIDAVMELITTHYVPKGEVERRELEAEIAANEAWVALDRQIYTIEFQVEIKRLKAQRAALPPKESA